MFEHFGSEKFAEKWEVYAEVIRSLFAEIGNLERSDATFRDSYDYTKQCRKYEADKALNKSN